MSIVDNWSDELMISFSKRFTGDTEYICGEIEKFKWVTAGELRDYLFPDTAEACYTLLR
jgi:hypothetical protein